MNDPLSERVFFFDESTSDRITYGQLCTRVTAVSADWDNHLQPKTAAETLIAIVAAMVIGAELTLHPPGAAMSEVRCSFSTNGRAPADSRALPVPTSPKRLLERAITSSGFSLTLFTSGSTGLPKHVTHTRQTLQRGLQVGSHHEQDIWGLAYDPTHIAGVQVLLQAFFNGNPLIQLFDKSQSRIYASIENHGITHLSATPTFYRLLLPANRTFPGVKAVTLGGERSDTLLHQKVREIFPKAKVRNVYASTETGTLFISEGEIFTVPSKLESYVRISEGQLEVAKALLGHSDDLNASQWYSTGDRVVVVSTVPLRFRFLGRDRDWVNVGGNKVDPGEVEDALRSFPGVRDARVFGRANSVVGQLLCAEVVAKPALDEMAIRNHLERILPTFKVPRLVFLIERIERTRTGKLLRS